MELVLATRNAHKTRELCELLEPEFHLRDLTAFPQVGEIAETGDTFEQNATIKALAASRALPNKLIITDDSGLEVDALGGAPGVYSARFAGEKASDSDNVAKLLDHLHDVQPADRTARFRCVIVAVRNEKVIGVYNGGVEGTIATAPRGQYGFGYDPVFVPNGHAQTFAELTPDAKNALSHRARAAAQLQTDLTRLFG